MEKIGFVSKASAKLKHGCNRITKLCINSLHFADREIVEERNDVVQPICAGVIITKDKKVLVVNKTAKSTGKVSPEKDKSLLYIGGHLSIVDMQKSNIGTFKSGMKREILEEIGLDVKETCIKNPIVTYTPTTEKSAKHCGVIFPIEIEKPFNTTFTDGKCKFVDISGLKGIHNFEPWSEIILKEIINKQISPID